MNAAYIVLFRGVGGATQLPVDRLREVLSRAGFLQVGTYINSGNAFLASPLDPAQVAVDVAAAVRKEMASPSTFWCAARVNGVR